MMDSTSYLKRFHAFPVENLYLQDLSMLQSLHMQHVPFENLDVIRKKPIYLNLETIYDKIVNHNRGGYCYELNGLFHWLLRELGFDAKLISATVLKPDGTAAKKDTHAAILVELDTLYLIDVGFGDSTATPIPLGGERHTDLSGTYRIEALEGEFYGLIRQDEDSNERILYRFNTEEKRLADFHEGCVFNQVSSESTFTHDDLATRATEDGRITLTGNVLIHTKDGANTKRSLSPEEKVKVLKEDFGLELEM